MIVNTLKMCTGDAGPEQSLVLFFKNLMIREGAEHTENQDFKLRNMEHRDSFHRNKRTGTHWEGLNIFSYAKILCAQTMAIICI